jgi:hypothetical protein
MDNRTGQYINITGVFYILAYFNRRLFITTLTELSAIAAPASIGSSKKPVNA